MADTTATPQRMAERIEEQNALLESKGLSEVERAQVTISLVRTRVVIAHEVDGAYRFGTLRFVGFDVPAADYQDRRKDLNTTLADRAVLRFATEVGTDHPAWEAMLAWMHRYGVRPNAKVRVYLLRLGQPLPKPVTDADTGRRMAEHVFGLFTLLPADEREALKRRIAAHG